MALACICQLRKHSHHKGLWLFFVLKSNIFSLSTGSTQGGDLWPCDGIGSPVGQNRCVWKAWKSISKGMMFTIIWIWIIWMIICDNMDKLINTGCTGTRKRSTAWYRSCPCTKKTEVKGQRRCSQIQQSTYKKFIKSKGGTGTPFYDVICLPFC